MERLIALPLLVLLSLASPWAHASPIVVFGSESQAGAEAPPQALENLATGQPLDNESRRQLAYGEALYHYYKQDPYTALMLLEVETARGTFTNSTHYAALLNAELLLHFGLNERADDKIKLLLVQDTLAQTRAMILLRRAEVDYQNHQYDKAIPQLEELANHPLPQEAEIQRRLLLTNIYTRREDFSAAENVLTTASLDHPDGGYLGYNLGVVMIRAGQLEEGLAVLKKVVARHHNTEEDEALKDRALLAIGLTELQRQDYSRALAALGLIRSNSPYVKQALHASALAYYFDFKPSQALPFWQRLQQEDFRDATVQESLLFSAHAHEQMGDLVAAQAGYSTAVEHFTQLIKELETVEKTLNNNWPASLIGSPKNLEGDLSERTITTLAANRHADLLGTLFKQQYFLTQLNYYQETQALINTFKNQLSELERYLDLAQERDITHIAIQSDLQIGLKKIAERLLIEQGEFEYSKDIDALELEATFAYFKKHITQRLAQTQQLEQTLSADINATAKQHIRQHKIQLNSLLAEAHLATARVQDQLLQQQ